MMPAAPRPPVGGSSAFGSDGMYGPPFFGGRFGALGGTAPSDGFPSSVGIGPAPESYAPSSWKQRYNTEAAPSTQNGILQIPINSVGRQQPRPLTQSFVIKRPQPDPSIPPVPVLTVPGDSSSTSAMGLEAPRPIMRHRSSKVRFSSPLRQELKKLEEEEGEDQDANAEDQSEPKAEPTSRLKRSVSFSHRSGSTKARGGGKVIWAKSVHGGPGPEEAGPSTGSKRSESPMGVAPVVRRTRSLGNMKSQPSEGLKRGSSQRSTGPQRLRKAPTGLWGDLAASSSSPARSATIGHGGRRSAPLGGDPVVVDASQAPKFSRSGLKRSSVVLPTPKGPRPSTPKGPRQPTRANSKDSEDTPTTAPKARPPSIALPSKADTDEIQAMNLNSPKEGRPASCGPTRVARSPSTRLTGLVRKLSKRKPPGVSRSKSTSSRSDVPEISGPILQDITHMDVPGRPGFKVSLQHTTRGLQLQPVKPASPPPSSYAPSSFRSLSTTPTPRTPSEPTSPVAASFRALSTTPTPRITPTPPPLSDVGFAGYLPLKAPLADEPYLPPGAALPRKPSPQLHIPLPSPPRPVPAIQVIDSVEPNNGQLRAGRVPVHTVPAPQRAPVRSARPDSHLSTVSGVSRRVSIYEMDEFGALTSPPPGHRSTFFSVPNRQSVAPEYVDPEWDEPGSDAREEAVPEVPQRASSLTARSNPSTPALKAVDDRASRRRSLSVSSSPRTQNFTFPPRYTAPSPAFSAPPPAFVPPPSQPRQAGTPRSLDFSTPQKPRVSSAPSPKLVPSPHPQPRQAGTPRTPIEFSNARSNFQARPRSSLSARRSVSASVKMLALDEVDEPLPGPESAPLPHTREEVSFLPPVPDVGPMGLPQGRRSWRRGHQTSLSLGTLDEPRRNRSNRSSMRSASARSSSAHSISIRSRDRVSRASLATAHSGRTTESFFSDEASTASTVHPLSTPDLLLADIADEGNLPDLPATIPQSWSLPQMARLSLTPGPPTEPLPDLPGEKMAEIAEVREVDVREVDVREADVREVDMPEEVREVAEPEMTMPETAAPDMTVPEMGARGMDMRQVEVRRPVRADSRSSEDESTPSLSNDHSQSASEEPMGIPLTPPFTPMPFQPPAEEILAEPVDGPEISATPVAVDSRKVEQSASEHIVPSPDDKRKAYEASRGSRTPVIAYDSTASARLTPAVELPVKRKVTIVRRGAEKISSFPLSTPLVLGDVYQPNLGREDDEWSLASVSTHDSYGSNESQGGYESDPREANGFTHSGFGRNHAFSVDTHDAYTVDTHGTFTVDTHGAFSEDLHDAYTVDTHGGYSEDMHGTFTVDNHGAFSEDLHGAYSEDLHSPSIDHHQYSHYMPSVGHGSHMTHESDFPVDATDELDGPPAPAFRKRHMPQSSITSAMSVSTVGHEAAIVEVTRAKTAMAMELRL